MLICVVVDVTVVVIFSTLIDVTVTVGRAAALLAAGVGVVTNGLGAGATLFWAGVAEGVCAVTVANTVEVNVIIRVVVGSTDVSVDIKVSVRVVTSSGFVLVGMILVSGLCAVLVGTAAGTKVVDVELSMATDGIACALVFGRLVPASEMDGTGLTVFSGWEVLKVVGMTTGMLVSDVTAELAPASPAIARAVDVGMIAAEDGCVLRAVELVDGLDVGTTAVEGALCVVNVEDGSTVGTIVIGTEGTLCAVTVGTEALGTVPVAADAAVENPDAPGTAGIDDTPPCESGLTVEIVDGRDHWLVTG